MHKIQLRGPWQTMVLSRATSCARANDGITPQESEWQRVALGDWSAWLGRVFRGVVRYERRFGCPTGLLPATKVGLVVEKVDWQAELSLNDQLLGSIRWEEAPFRGDIRGLLQSRNRLTIDVSLPEWTEFEDRQHRGNRAGQPGGLLGEVYLDISD